MGSAISSLHVRGRILSLQTCLCSSQVEIGWLGRVDPSTDPTTDQSSLKESPFTNKGKKIVYD